MWPFKKKPKLTTFWCISDKENPDHFYTFTNTYEEAAEYLVKLYIYKNKYEHFLQWCEFHEKDKSDFLVICEYIQSLEVNPADYYNIGTISYTQENMASLFRIYNNCVPLNCSFETKFEQETYLELMKALKEQGINMEEDAE